MTTTTETPVENEAVFDETAYGQLASCIGELATRYDHLEAMVGEYNHRIAALEGEAQAPDINQHLREAVQALAQSGMALNKMLLEGQKDLAGLELSWELGATPASGRC